MSESPTRRIAREAIRERLLSVALEQVLAIGFDAVTIEDLAQAAGVSRSTFLRYVGSKPEAVVGGFSAIGSAVADRLRARPLDEPRPDALRRALDVIVEWQGSDSEPLMELLHAVKSNPALDAAMWRHRDAWRVAIAAVLRERDDELTEVRAHAVAAAALGCLDAAVAAQREGISSRPFAELLDEAFSTL